MKTATTPEMTTARKNQSHAFTIIELLMVIAIMAVVAGLIVGLAAVTGDSKKIKRTEAELAKLVTLIEAYKTKVGVYPPDNPSDPHINSLLYELSGAIRKDPGGPNPIYETPFGNITSNEIWTAYGGTDVFPAPERRAGLLNAIDEGSNSEDAKVHRILKDLSPDQIGTVAGHRSLVVPVDDANGQRPNPWRYRVGNPNNPQTRNPETFDLWVEIYLGRTNGVPKTKTIGNWKN